MSRKQCCTTVSHKASELNHIVPSIPSWLTVKCLVPRCSEHINMFREESWGIFLLPANQQLQDLKREELSPPPLGLPARWRVTVNPAPTCVEIPQSTEVLERGQNVIPAVPSGEVRATGPPTSSHIRLYPSELTCVTSLLQERQSCPLPALVSPSPSIHLHISPWLPSSWLHSPQCALSDASGRILLSQGAQTTRSRPADRQTEAEIAPGLSNSMSSSRRSFNLHLSLTHALASSLKPSSSLSQPY